MNEVRNILVGMEIGPKEAQLSYYDRKVKEPVSVPVKVGSNLYTFPVALVKLRGRDEWRFGYEAEYFEKLEDGIPAQNPFEAARRGEAVETDGLRMEGSSLLAIFIRESLRLLCVPQPVSSIAGICVTCERLDGTLALSVLSALREIGFRPGQCFVCDREESFYYYSYSQKPEIYARSLALIRFDGSRAVFSKMSERRASRPYAVTMEDRREFLLPEEEEARDEAFGEAVKEYMEGSSWSSVFITGEGFSTDWAKQSVKLLSKAASHVFEGDNLFVKGACWAVFEKLESRGFDGRLYIGADTLRSTAGMDVIEGGQQRFLPLVSAGNSYYLAGSTVDVILDGRDDLLITVRAYDKSSHRNQRTVLEGLPERPARTTRLRVSAVCMSREELLVTAEDLGFGELFPATHKTWEMRVSL